MKSVCKSKNTPFALSKYIQSYPVGTSEHNWDCFCENTALKKEVQEQLRKDQRGICAYCEIDLIILSNQDVQNDCKADFRVEHFHPKQDNDCWQLEWQNLFACCHGGSEKHLQEAGRFAETRAERSCDVPKKDNVWDDSILNPLKIPAFPPLFCYCDDGQLKVDEGNCRIANICPGKVKFTIESLHLNCDRLKKFRMNIIDKVKEQINICLQESNDNIAIAMKNIADILFSCTDDWPPFFTAIRSYLGNTAEARLKEMNYNG